ncbi:MAG: hypothetical protein ACK4E3_03555 [Brevundimonas sp.]|uniref:hypothetical protein n=1 Tax=Brevundimonas sp. TaxID=1871086 RepID=UPI003919893A
MTRYAIIDNPSGYIWGVTDAADPIDACRKIDQEIGGETREYDTVPRFSFGNEAGYHVYEVPADYNVDDGQSEREIARLETEGTLVGRVSYRAEA